MNQLEWEKQAYGSTKAEILESIEDSLTFRMSGMGMIIASYLSDAQELIEFNDKNRARQYINIAMMLIIEKMDAEV